MSENLVGAKLGNYRLERLLGRGRMGVVYLAHDEALLRPTAVKILSWLMPDSHGQNPEVWFLAEARNAARVNHAHVVQIYSVARHGGYCYIAMEYVDGTTADVWIERSGPFSIDRATELLIQISGAVQAAHEANVVHRDIKPENLLVGNDGNAKLGDFGMAMHTARPSAINGVRAGTPYYAAPEIWRNEAASVLSDIYALGATYHFLLTGRPPFAAKDLNDLIAAHLNAEVPEIQTPFGKAPLPCQEILRRCMAKSPGQRFPSAQALGWEARSALRQLSSTIPPLAVPTGDVSVSSTMESATPSALANVVASVAGGDAIACVDDWRRFFSFVREPFARVEVERLPYSGEPFASTITHLDERLRADGQATVILTGPIGAGRTSVAQTLLARQVAHGPGIYLSCDTAGATSSVAKRALRAIGLHNPRPVASATDIDALVESCLSVNQSQAMPLLVIDDCEQNAEGTGELSAMTMAAQLSGAFRLLLIGKAGFERRLALADGALKTAPVSRLAIAALQGSEVGAYIKSWLDYAQAPDAMPIAFSPDALLAIWHFSAGNAMRINRIVTAMLIAGAARQRRVFDSWDAWAASLPAAEARRQERPLNWPPPEVLDLLNRYRQQVGIPPRR